jgi:hypothetical protein
MTRYRRLIPRIAVGAIVALALGAGTSYAYFVTTASGSSVAGVGNLQSITVATAGTPTSPLLPGGSGDVEFAVTNPNDTPITLTGVALNGTTTPDPPHSECTTTDGRPVVTLSVPSGDLPVSIPANSTKTVDLAGAAAMDVAATNDCQGASFSLPLTFTAQQ